MNRWRTKVRKTALQNIPYENKTKRIFKTPYTTNSSLLHTSSLVNIKRECVKWDAAFDNFFAHWDFIIDKKKWIKYVWIHETAKHLALTLYYNTIDMYELASYHRLSTCLHVIYTHFNHAVLLNFFRHVCVQAFLLLSFFLLFYISLS